MAQTPDQIRQHIESRRERLAEDIHELEARVKTAADWRRQFERHTGLVLGGAFAAGVVLGLITGAPPRGMWRF